MANFINEEYLQQPDSRPISLTLPKQQELNINLLNPKDEEEMELRLNGKKGIKRYG